MISRRTMKVSTLESFSVYFRIKAGTVATLPSPKREGSIRKNQARNLCPVCQVDR